MHDVSFDVRAGEIFGLAGLLAQAGPNSRECFSASRRPIAAAFRLNGEASDPFTAQAIDHGIGYVPEDRRRHG